MQNRTQIGSHAIEIRQLLGAFVKFHASDVQAQVGSPPSLRIHGDITSLELPELSMDHVDGFALRNRGRIRARGDRHTTNAPMTVQRIVAMFPPEEREALLMQLSTNLEAVFSQRLAKTRESGRVPVAEIMRASPVIRKAILEGRAGSLPQAIANRGNGMQLFDQHLADLYNEGILSTREAQRLASNPEALTAAMRGISRADTSAGLAQ